MLLTFALTGCKWGSEATCAIENTISTSVAGVIAAQLKCSDQAAIEADIKTSLQKLNMCSQPVAAPAAPGAQSAVGAVVCPLAINAVTGLLNTAVPAKWGCTGSVTPDAIKGMLITACTSVL